MPTNNLNELSSSRVVSPVAWKNNCYDLRESGLVTPVGLDVSFALGGHRNVIRPTPLRRHGEQPDTATSIPANCWVCVAFGTAQLAEHYATVCSLCSASTANPRFECPSSPPVHCERQRHVQRLTVHG